MYGTGTNINNLKFYKWAAENSTCRLKRKQTTGHRRVKQAVKETIY